MFVYQIISLNNQKKYIGITNDFNRRMREHKTCHNPESLIDQAIQLDGENKFSYEIIEECNSYEELFQKEKYYITLYNTRFPNGYNQTDGGDCMLGTSNGRSKFSFDEITEIRTRFNNNENYLDIYKDFSKVSLGQFLKILKNKTYLDNPLRCKEKSLYNQGYLTKLKNNQLKFSKDEVVYFRDCWKQGINFKDIYSDYKDICSKDYFYQVYYGILYKDICPEVFTDELKRLHSSLSHSGENNGKAKLTREIVLEARKRYAEEKISYSQLAREYGVTATAMRLAIIGKTWKNI